MARNNPNPSIVGWTEIPKNYKDYNGINKRIAALMSDAQPGQALQIAYSDHEEALRGRKCLNQAVNAVYGTGKVQSAIEDNLVFLWWRQHEHDSDPVATFLSQVPEGAND